MSVERLQFLSVYPGEIGHCRWTPGKGRPPWLTTALTSSSKLIYKTPPTKPPNAERPDKSDPKPKHDTGDPQPKKDKKSKV